MNGEREAWDEAADWMSYGFDNEAIEVPEEQSDIVFRSFREACEWSRENAGRAFTRCANGVDFRPVRGSEAHRATQSWHEFEELYEDGPYRNEMG